MLQRLSLALVFISFPAASATAQVVRFETSVGEFDMVLNPTNNALLQPHVENMLQYVEENSYRSSWINRADENFVLQMGGFYSHTKRPPPTVDSVRPVFAFDPVPGEPATTINGLSNTVGTVALALPGDGLGGTNQDAGTTSFFINLASNSFLDADFTVFAAIPDMTVVNQIMALMQIDRTLDPTFGAGAGNLAYADVPLLDNGFQVFINRTFVVNDAMSVARAMAGIESVLAHSTGSGTATEAHPPATVVPEPASLLMVAVLLSGAALAAPRRQRR